MLTVTLTASVLVGYLGCRLHFRCCTYTVTVADNTVDMPLILVVDAHIIINIIGIVL